MPYLKNYNQFSGIHWETGTLKNYLEYRQFYTPHANRPYTEALLLGISGGIVMGYFSFAYKGYDPFIAILTRNTFQPWNTILNRLAVPEEPYHTTQPKKAVKNLIQVLNEGIPAIVWADEFSLPYNCCEKDSNMWAMFPLIVYGYDEQQDKVWIADRAGVPLVISTKNLEAARARVKKLKFAIVVLDLPNEKQFVSAIQKGIWDCIKLYLEKPPKGSKHNFGLLAFQRWADLLTKSNKKMSWAKEFPRGVKLYCGLKSAFGRIALFGQSGIEQDAERGLYSLFLEEASVILNKPKLKLVAQQFKESALAWRSLANLLLLDDVEELHKTKLLLVEKHRIFREQGVQAKPRIIEINKELNQIKTVVSKKFPIKKKGIENMLQQLSDKILTIHDLEKEAVLQLQKIMSL